MIVRCTTSTTIISSSTASLVLIFQRQYLTWLIHTRRNFDSYPAHKNRGQHNTQAMCAAEANLDKFWAIKDAFFAAFTGFGPPPIVQACLDEGGKIQRTAPWQEKGHCTCDKCYARTTFSCYRTSSQPGSPSHWLLQQDRPRAESQAQDTRHIRANPRRTHPSPNSWPDRPHHPSRQANLQSHQSPLPHPTRRHK